MSETPAVSSRLSVHHQSGEYPGRHTGSDIQAPRGKGAARTWYFYIRKLKVSRAVREHTPGVHYRM